MSVLSLPSNIRYTHTIQFHSHKRRNTIFITLYAKNLKNFYCRYRQGNQMTTILAVGLENIIPSENVYPSAHEIFTPPRPVNQPVTETKITLAIISKFILWLVFPFFLVVLPSLELYISKRIEKYFFLRGIPTPCSVLTTSKPSGKLDSNNFFFF